VLLAAGSWQPPEIRRGWRAVRDLQARMDEGRRRRLAAIGFPDDEAAELSALHTRNFMCGSTTKLTVIRPSRANVRPAGHHEDARQAMLMCGSSSRPISARGQSDANIHPGFRAARVATSQVRLRSPEADAAATAGQENRWASGLSGR
jgi:hypothetical protein